MFFDYSHRSLKQTEPAEEQPFFKPAPVVSEHFFAGKTMTQTASSGIVQRQKKPLAGMQPNHIVDYRVQGKVDAALQQSPTVSPHIQSKLKAGARVKGSVKDHGTRADFEQACTQTGNSANTCKSAGGFYHRKSDVIHLPPRPLLESMLHEAIHKFSSDFRTSGFINEGLTQLFTNIVLAENGLAKGIAYPDQTKVAEAISKKIGLANLAKIFFTGKFVDLDAALAKSVSNFSTRDFILMASKKETAKLLQYLK